MLSAQPFAKRTDAVVARSLLDPEIVDALANHARLLEREGGVERDPQIAGRLVAHNEPVFRRYHAYLAAELNRRFAFEEPLKPSYCYLCVYSGGVELFPHRDRPECAYNLTVVVEQTPQRPSFPLCVRVEGSDRELDILPGDGGLFSGTDVLHWRPPVPAGARLVACIYHFVPESHGGPLD